MTKASKRSTTLTVRAEFQRVRGGFRFSCPLFVLEGKDRSADRDHDAGTGHRFGLTVSKKVGNAVVRNRIKRRLRAALREIRPPETTRTDFVIVARTALAEAPYPDILAALQRGLQRITSMRTNANRGTPKQVQT